MKKNGKTLVNLSTKTFIQVVVLLFVLMLAAIVLTYVIPKGAFGTTADGKRIIWIIGPSRARRAFRSGRGFWRRSSCSARTTG